MAVAFVRQNALSSKLLHGVFKNHHTILEKEKNFNEILNDMPEGVLIIGKDGKARFINKFLAKIISRKVSNISSPSLHEDLDRTNSAIKPQNSMTLDDLQRETFEDIIIEEVY